MFWAAEAAPAEFAAATAAFGIPALHSMDPQTQQDFRLLRRDFAAGRTPCSPGTDATTKCEACAGGCQLYTSIPDSLGMGNERTHYSLPPASSGEPRDMLLYRTSAYPNPVTLWASKRQGSAQSGWSRLTMTNIPNDCSNLNAGRLGDGYASRAVQFHPDGGQFDFDRSPARMYAP